ncbi:MAG: hypothetical protein LC751_08925 [Actinobacteria bacterium]|nr:hypothetical protein [Actinomycetota bacterium]
MPRRATLIRALAALLPAACILAGCGSEAQDSSSTVQESEQAMAGGSSTGETKDAVDTTTEETSERMRCSEEERTNGERGELRIGDFEPPEEVPAYKIIEEKRIDKYGAKSARLLVDTRSRSEEDYTLITRDIKSRYSELDAVGIEFTDTTGTLSYNGGAVIFNTPCGSDYIGYIFRPPNNEGYHVIVPKD